MPTPYWGSLPSPVVMSERRRSSEDGARGSSQLPRANRASTQTATTIDSPFASPVDSVFPQQGLAPRPPSLHSGRQGHERDFQEKRRRRERDRSQFYEDEPPPAAPDVPRNAPPISYKPNSYDKEPVRSNTTRSRSSRDKNAPESGRGRRRLSREETGDEYPTTFLSEPRSTESRGRGQRNKVAEGEPYLSENVTVHRGSSRRGNKTHHQSSTTKDVAQERSPLQRLERTLSETGKEERREKLRRAESLAKEREIEREVENNDLRSKEQSTRKPVQANKGERIPPKSSDGSRGVASRDEDLLQPSPPLDFREAVPPETRIGRSENRHELKPTISQSRSVSRSRLDTVDGNISRNNSISRPRTVDDRPKRSNSFRNRISAATTGTAAAIGITRTNSNKLKKDPPGDPWFNIRMEAERVGNQRAQSQRRREPPPEEHEYDSIDELEGIPVRSNSSRKIEQLTGSDVGLPPRKVAPQQHQPYAERLDRSQPLTPPGNRKVHPEPRQHHHLSDLLHRHQYEPGKGLYAPRRSLSEWRKPVVARLTGSLLDMDYVATEAEKDKAWWEAGNKGARRSSSLKPKLTEIYDGAYDDTRGRVPVQLSDSIGPNSSSSSLNPTPWTEGHDPVVPRARQYIGYQGTSDSVARIKRRNRSWLLRAKTASPRASKIFSSPILSPYSSTCPYPSQHKLSHPFHVCSPENIALTRSMRSIRVRSQIVPTRYDPPLFVKCGPLLRYCGIRRETIQSRSRPDTSLKREIWRGTIMIVTTDSESKYLPNPTLKLFLQPLDLMSIPPEQVDGSAGDLAPEHVDPIAGLPKIGRRGETKFVRPVEHLEEELDLSRDETDDGLFESHRSKLDMGAGFDGVAEDPRGSFAGRHKRRGLDGEKAGKFKDVPGVRLHAEQGVTFWRFHVEVELRPQQQRIAYRINGGPATAFWVPARGQSMNIMFHSCNGFSMSVNPDQFSGPDPMWRDVLNTHQSQPFHVMLGGGDQLYNDAVMKQTEVFQDWLEIKNPHDKHNAPFTPHMQEELETFYLERYSMWFSQGLFGLANSQIPMVNIYDDHDIIDGFGSYPDHFMRSPVFSGLGAVAFKYYMLFQHQSIIDEGEDTESSWILGAAPGPYIKELSRSVFMSLGKEVAFLGLDCRTERMRDEIVSHETYNKVLDRCEAEIVKGETKHLIVLLGVPIAYPRLVWLENILTSRLMDPIKAVGRSGIFGNFLNQFDGGVEVLDDLDDHWTAKNHKEERNWFVRELQHLAGENSIRVTILGGDVHLAAIGQFYSNPKLGIPKDRDHRYMPNIISSAIVNTPPPEMMADVLNKRNKVHHLDRYTDEDMIPIFTHDVNGSARNNKRLLPRRNWCSIKPYVPGSTPPQTPSDRNTPSPPLPPAGFLRRPMSSRGPTFRSDAPTFRSDAPPVTTRGRSVEPVRHSRSLSLSRGIFRLSSRRRDSGGINGYGDDSDDDDQTLDQRGYTSQQQISRPTPFHRSPTTLSEKQRKAGLIGPINLEHGLEVTLNVEISQKDPAGITVPYKLLVPALSYEKNDSWEEIRRPSALSRFVSFGRGRSGS